MAKASKTTSGDTETQITIFTDRINNINIDNICYTEIKSNL